MLANVPTTSVAPIKVVSDENSITLRWSASSDGGSPIIGYMVYQTNVTTGGEFLVYDGSVIPTVDSTKITDLTTGHQY